MTARDYTALRAVYGSTPTPDDEARAAMRRQLAELGEGLAGQLAELEREFTVERADQVIRSLHGVATHVRRLAAGEVAE